MTQIIPETPPEFDRTRITERPDGFYWQAKDDGREYRPPRTTPQPELNEASRAQLGPDEEQRPYRPRKSDASVEYPLKD